MFGVSYCDGMLGVWMRVIVVGRGRGVEGAVVALLGGVGWMLDRGGGGGG